jgi:hypothetical protein
MDADPLNRAQRNRLQPLQPGMSVGPDLVVRAGRPSP